jgi:3'-5' exoribonuclease
MDRVCIRDIRSENYLGKEVIDFYALRKIELKTKESDGKAYLNMELGDATGRIDAVMWNEAEKAFKEVSQGDVVQVKGLAGKYKDNPQLRVENIRRAGEDEYRLEFFMPGSERTKAELEAGIRAEMAAVKNPALAKLLKVFFDDPAFLEKFLAAPAAKLWHHAHLGGLAEHTLGVCRLARAALNNYQLLDADLLLTGCLLHDMGKMREFSVTTYIDYSDEGRLVGHVVLGDQMLMERIPRVKDFPKELEKRLRHMILAHHGEKEKGSPVVPSTLEALIVHHCDYMDSHAAAFTRIIRREGLQNKRWSDYVNLIDRYIYLAKTEAQSGGEREDELKLF